MMIRLEQRVRDLMIVEISSPPHGIVLSLQALARFCCYMRVWWVMTEERLLCTCAAVQVRDITTRSSWEEMYGLVIPVLTHTSLDGSNEVMIRNIQ